MAYWYGGGIEPSRGRPKFACEDEKARKKGYPPEYLAVSRQWAKEYDALGIGCIAAIIPFILFVLGAGFVVLSLICNSWLVGGLISFGICAYIAWYAIHKTPAEKAWEELDKKCIRSIYTGEDYHKK